MKNDAVSSVRCVLCGEAMNAESPYEVFDYNPMTFREAWMHGFCADVALQDLRFQDASSSDYQSRYDEYLTRFA